MEIVLRESLHQNWITLLIIGCLIVLSIGKFFYNQSFFDAINVLGADRFTITRTRGLFILQPLQLIFIVVQCVGVSLLIFIVYCKYLELSPQEEVGTYLLILSGYTLFETTKFLLETFTSYTLHVSKETNPLTYKRLNIKNLIGILSLICSAILIFNTGILFSILQIIVAIIVITYIFSQVWLLRKYQNEIIRFPFYFILYFCTLEIAPYFILYKFVIK